jgi:uncharacterized protein YodC (DUF2158 family)/DNA-binding winged helix-turn-helix (wHTH) protein
MDDFKIGDLVHLKSGGPRMTVKSVDPQNGRVYCQWFTGNTLAQDNFPIEALVNHPPTGELVTPVGEIAFHGINFNRERRTLVYKGRLILLTPHEASMIDLFFSQPGTVFTHTEMVLTLANKILANQEAAELTRPLMHRLSGKIRSIIGNENWFQNVKGTGYLFAKDGNE